MAKRVMTVDDSATVRSALLTSLEEAGYEVCLAKDGEEALHMLQNERIDMLVTDLNMPKMNGIELITEVRRMPGNRFMPIIMLTSETQPELKIAGKNAGASGWVTKPFKPKQLQAVAKMVCPNS